MDRPAGWMAALTGRSAMKSPGAPALRREVERELRREIAQRLLAEEAAAGPQLGAEREGDASPVWAG